MPKKTYRTIAGIALAVGIGMTAGGVIDHAQANGNYPPGCGMNYAVCPSGMASCSWDGRAWQCAPIKRPEDRRR